MRSRSSRLAVVRLGERLVVASVQGTRVETFTVDAESSPRFERVEFAPPVSRGHDREQLILSDKLKV